jgi:hypothetical protein
MRVTQPFGEAQGLEPVERQMSVFRQPLRDPLTGYVFALNKILHYRLDTILHRHLVGE